MRDLLQSTAAERVCGSLFASFARKYILNKKRKRQMNTNERGARLLRNERHRGAQTIAT